eukprot:6471799-Amphidinium_carterae.2
MEGRDCEKWRQDMLTTKVKFCVNSTEPQLKFFLAAVEVPFEPKTSCVICSMTAIKREQVQERLNPPQKRVIFWKGKGLPHIMNPTTRIYTECWYELGGA